MSRSRLFVLCALFISFTMISLDVAAARNIDRFLSGAWYNQAQSGHGFSIEVLDSGRVVIYWFTYHPDGTPTFLLAVGQANGNSVTASVYYNTGMHFGEFDPNDRTESPWGTITITFNDCGSATVQYNSTFTHEGSPFGSGSFPIQRLLSIDQLQCQNNSLAGIYEGLIYSSIEGTLYYGFILVSPHGEFAAFSAGGILALGEAQAIGSGFSMDGTAVSVDPDAPFTAPVFGQGQFSAEYRLLSSFDIQGGDSGSANFFAVPALYRRSLAPAQLAGSYDVSNAITGFTGNATITGEGSISGADELGCQYAGNIMIPDTRFNLFQVSLTIGNCPGYDGAYQGLGSQIDWDMLDDRRGLQVLVSDGNFGFFLLANK